MSYQPQQPHRAPYVPGTMPPNGDWGPPAPKPGRSRALPLLLGALGVAIVLVVAGIAALALWLKPGSTPEPAPAAAVTLSLADTEKACNLEHIGMKLVDGNKTLIINGQDDIKSDELATEWGHIRCVLENLGAPEAVVEHIKSTRALDGRQTDAWGSYSAAWTYHPDDGVDLTIQER